MSENDPRAFAETIFEREQRREKEIKNALKLEAERYEAALRNMHRLRALRLERDQKATATERSRSSQSHRDLAGRIRNTLIRRAAAVRAAALLT